MNNEMKKTKKLKAVFEERKKINKDDEERWNLSARRSKCASTTKKARKHEEVQHLLEEFRGINNISSIASARKKTLIPKIITKKDDIITSREGIANVFGKLHSKLHA